MFSFSVTTLFNFLSISLLLVGFKSLGLNSGITSLLAQLVGIFLSMFFAMDLWWKYVTKEITESRKRGKRVEFIIVAGVSGIISAIITGLILRDDQYKTTHLLITNWTCLAMIAVIKYFVFSKRLLSD